MSGWEIHEGLSKFDEGSTLKWFGQEIGNHFLCWAVFHDEIIMGNAVGDEKVAHIEVSCALWTQHSAILFEKDGTAVVLVKDDPIKIETLSMEKVIHSE